MAPNWFQSDWWSAQWNGVFGFPGSVTPPAPDVPVVKLGSGAGTGIGPAVWTYDPAWATRFRNDLPGLSRLSRDRNMRVSILATML